MNRNYKALAKEFFRGVYGSDPRVVDDLAGDDIVISYPIFEKFFDSPVLRGRESVKAFALGFNKRWDEIQITFHEAVAEKNQVVLVWHFKGRNVGRTPLNEEPSNEVHSWGGISLFRFNRSGKIVAEIGEESSPGPIERMAVEGD